ncbi:MAG: DUF2461 domain-containing protein [Saprospiraceae bacterium]|nr:DUF2461 domain-containing protein [Saprospiraceae bacterium]
MPLNTAFFNFFTELAQNNDRDWFNANKPRYEKDVKMPFLALLEQIVAELTDSEPDLALVPTKQMLFRINRDTRFSKDKRPYKEHFSASIGRFGTKDKIYPGHYLQVSPNEVFVAGGAYFFEEKTMLYRVRNFIAQHPERFAQLLDNHDFKDKYGEMKGEKNKRLPPEFVDDIARQPLIANTQFYWAATLSIEVALREDFAKILRGYFVAAQPLNEFFS